MAVSIEVTANSVTTEELVKMTYKELLNFASPIRDALNKRLKRLLNDKNMAFQDSRAYKFAQDTGGNFSTKGKNRNELLKEIFRMRKFLSYNDSSVSGVNKRNKELAKRLGIDWKILSKSEFKKNFFNLIHGLEADDFADIHLYGYEKMVKNVAQRLVKGEAFSGIHNAVIKDMDRDYLERQSRRVQGDIWGND